MSPKTSNVNLPPISKSENISRSECQFAMSFLIFLCFCCFPITVTAVLMFDPTALLNETLIPADAAVGSVIYRLRVSDTAFDYPIIFDIKNTSTVSVEALNCTRFNSVCQANLILKKKLEAGRFYDFKLEVRNQRGQTSAMNCSFLATDATTPIEKIFPGVPSLLTISENAGRNTELGSIIAKGNQNRKKSVYLELHGTLQFGIHQKLISEKDAEGTIILINPLDYETKTVHHLTVLANDPWTDMKNDTRNIAGWPLLVAVIDEQDTPPIFTIAPPTTILSPTLKPGDRILKVHAEDGDRGQPRPIRYSLDPKDPANQYFEIGENTGELILTEPISQIVTFSNQGQPILLKVTAEEVRSNSQEAPSQSTTVQLALIPPGVTSGSPTFGAIEYHALLDENAPVGTELDLPQAEITTEAGDVVTLTLEKNNGTFDIIPSAVEGFSKFKVHVHDNQLLDYEKRLYVECFIVAKEIGKGNYSARAKLTVVLNDVNDNPPKFSKSEFHGSVAEHAAPGTTVLVVEAYDVDREPGSKIKYTDLTGSGSELFNLEPDTGVITVANSKSLDAETFPKLSLVAKAADENGEGLTATSTVIITLLDINDHAPEFERDVYEFILNTDRTTFTTQAFVRATDSDQSPPNNEIKYQFLSPNEHLFLNEQTGEILVQTMWDNDELKTMKIRAYDQGVPRLYNDCEIRIYPPESKSRKMVFIVPGKYPDKHETERTLSALTGGRIVVDEIRPYTGYEPGATYVTRDQNGEKSVVVATVHYTKDSIVDIYRIQKIFDDQHQQQTINPNHREIIREKDETTIKQSSGHDLLWLLILFIVLAIIVAIILILCCICSSCPLYIPPKRRKVRNDEENMVERVVYRNNHGVGEGKETKSVQVAEWRKEAWSDDKEHADFDSLKRHEFERGSEKGGVRENNFRRSNLHQSQSMNQLNQADHIRDQLYIRDGNTDILRLVTRAGEDPRRFEVQQQPPPQAQYNIDSGKDILLRRFIDQQQAEPLRAQMLLPNAVSRLQTEHELLEASLRQHNALLRQLIIERERDLRLETQSLPAGTQTDQDRGTQTEPQYLRPPKRKVQSELELSDGSDEEIAIIKARARRRHKVMKSRKIRTPIQEESEAELAEKYEKSYMQRSIDKIEQLPLKSKEIRSSDSRKKRESSESKSSSRSGLRKDVLKEISASLNQSDQEVSDYEKYKTSPEDLYSDDSLEDVSPRSEKTTTDSGQLKSEPLNHQKHRRRSESTLSQDETKKLPQRYRSESDLRQAKTSKKTVLDKKIAKEKSQSHADLTATEQKKEKKKEKKPLGKKTSRYMEWYTKNKTDNENHRKSLDSTVDGEKANKQPVVESRLYKDTKSTALKKKSEIKKSSVGPEHPLLQHSQHRYEIQYPKKRPEEDEDSGIAITKPEKAKKKSIFTIAYNDIHTSQLRPDSSVNTP